MQQQPADKCLYARLLGDSWHALPASVQALHSISPTLEVTGRARVDRGTNMLARIVAGVFRFPRAADDVAVRVLFERTETKEVWTRTFGNRRFRSIQSEARSNGLLCERFGMFTIRMTLVPEQEKLRLVIRGWRFLGIPLPSALAPRGDTYEFDDDGTFNFHVEVRVPIAGLVVRYAGYLEPSDHSQ